MELGENEVCSKCARAIGLPDIRWAEHDSNLYCEGCAAKVDREYKEANSCSICNRLFLKSDMKIAMPAMVYLEQGLPQSKRLMCTDCYAKVASRRPVRYAERGRRRFSLMPSIDYRKLDRATVAFG